MIPVEILGFTTYDLWTYSIWEVYEKKSTPPTTYFHAPPPSKNDRGSKALPRPRIFTLLPRVKMTGGGKALPRATYSPDPKRPGEEIRDVTKGVIGCNWMLGGVLFLPRSKTPGGGIFGLLPRSKTPGGGNIPPPSWPPPGIG